MKLPRPVFDEESEKPRGKCEVLLMGTNRSGIVVKVYKDRMEINGYYESEYQEDKRFANLPEPISMDWEELEKAKQRVVLPPRVVEAMTPDYEDNPPEEYLATLPKVHINGMLFYIDGDKKERRLVERPNQVFKYFKKRKIE
jgi:hypothetical protein